VAMPGVETMTLYPVANEVNNNNRTKFIGVSPKNL